MTHSLHPSSLLVLSICAFLASPSFLQSFALVSLETQGEDNAMDSKVGAGLSFQQLLGLPRLLFLFCFVLLGSNSPRADFRGGKQVRARWQSILTSR